MILSVKRPSLRAVPLGTTRSSQLLVCARVQVYTRVAQDLLLKWRVGSYAPAVGYTYEPRTCTGSNTTPLATEGITRPQLASRGKNMVPASTNYSIVHWFQSGLALKAHRFLHHSTPGLRVTKKRRERGGACRGTRSRSLSASSRKGVGLLY